MQFAVRTILCSPSLYYEFYLADSSVLFRLLLRELGFQAGQHEVVAETLNNKLQNEAVRKSKEIAKKTKLNMKDAKKISEYLNKSYKDLEKSKIKYQRSFLEMEEAKTIFTKADSEGTISRNEITKLRVTMDARTGQYEDHRGLYAQQLVKTNRHQAEYYSRELAGVLASLEALEVERAEYWKGLLGQCVGAEQEVAPIIAKCRADMRTALDNVDTAEDCRNTVHRY